MIVPTGIALLKYSLYGKMGVVALWLGTTTLAVTEAFIGQLVIALAVALIGAMPPTLAIIVASRTIKKKQDEIAHAVDGKLNDLMKAKEEAAKAVGKQEERVEERDRVAAAVLVPVAPVVVEPIQMEIVNKEDNPVRNLPVDPTKK